MSKIIQHILHITTTTFILTILIAVSCALISSCGTTKIVYLPGETKIEYRDTTIYRDSIQYTPIEVIKEIVPEMDTLKMETSLAEAKSYIDTTNRVLRGEIKNKKGITNEVHYKDRIVYKDSIITKPYPVEVTKEVIKYKHYWYDKLCYPFAIIGLIYIILIIIKLYGKFRL